MHPGSAWMPLDAAPILGRLGNNSGCADKTELLCTRRVMHGCGLGLRSPCSHQGAWPANEIFAPQQKALPGNSGHL
eukprot:3640836-Pyramimonas_sp.AAC.1